MEKDKGHRPLPGGPVRYWRRRVKGSKLPRGVLSLTRPSMWSNPYRIGDPGVPTAAVAVARYREYLAGDVMLALAAWRELAGKDLACWCGLGEPCHVDWLIRLANGPRPITAEDILAVPV